LGEIVPYEVLLLLNVTLILSDVLHVEVSVFSPAAASARVPSPPLEAGTLMLQLLLVLFSFVMFSSLEQAVNAETAASSVSVEKTIFFFIFFFLFYG
jgi:hypothetical protein